MKNSFSFFSFVSAILFAVLVTIGCDGPIEGYTPEDGSAASDIFGFDFGANCVDGDLRAECKSIAGLAVSASTNIPVSLSKIDDEGGVVLIVNVALTTVSQIISFDAVEGMTLKISGTDLCAGEVRVYAAVAYSDGTSSPTTLLYECDNAGNLVFRIVDESGIETAGTTPIDYDEETPQDPTDPTDPTCEELDNCPIDPVTNPQWSAGTGDPSVGANQLKWNLVCSAKSGSTLSNIRQYLLSQVNGLGDGQFSNWSQVTVNANFVLTNGSLNTMNVNANGLAGGWLAVKSNNANGTVNSEQMSCVLSAADYTSVAFELAKDQFWLANTDDGGNVVFRTEHDTTAHTIRLLNNAGTIIESRSY